MTQIQQLKERQTIDNTIDVLKDITGFKIEWTQPNLQANAQNEGIYGFAIINNQTFPIELSANFSLSRLPAILQKQKKYPHLILITPYLTDKLKSILKENNINYLDEAGNAYIRLSSSFIFIDGKKALKKAEIDKDKAFTKKGIAVVFHLLTDENLVNQTYRRISEVTGASLDTITKVMQSLSYQGFILKIDNKTVQLFDKKRLFDKWADAYENRLKPHLFVARFRFLSVEEQLNWEHLSLNSSSIWGGEPAAAILTDFLRPHIFTLYSTETKSEIMRHYRLVPDQSGNVYVYFPFFNTNIEKTQLPLLTYADLMSSGNARNQEVAEKIYQQYVKEIL